MGSLEPNDRELAAYWMPFTHNRYFKQHHNRRMLAKAEGAYYWTTEGDKLFDAPVRPVVLRAGPPPPEDCRGDQEQLDAGLRPAFQMRPPPAFKLAEQDRGMAPGGHRPGVLRNSGSEAVGHLAEDGAGLPPRARARRTAPASSAARRATTASASAASPWAASVANRKMFASAMLPGVDHLPPHPRPRANGLHARASPALGPHLADELERLIAAARRVQHRRRHRRADRRARPASSSRPRATCSACARSAPSTASCSSSTR